MSPSAMTYDELLMKVQWLDPVELFSPTMLVYPLYRRCRC